MKLTCGFSIPIYDTPLELHKCLQSLSLQTIKPDEIVVVDDSSPRRQEIEAICRDWGVWYIYAFYGEKRFRKCQAMNAGSSVLSTDVVFYSQGDMAYPSDYVERHIRLHSKFANIAVYPHIYHFNNPGTLKQITRFDEIGGTSFCAEYRHMVIFSTCEDIKPSNGVGLTCSFSVARDQDVKWDNKFVSTSADEDDYYHRLLEAGVFPAIFDDIRAYHIHCSERDVSFFDVGFEDASQYYADKRRGFTRYMPVPLVTRGQ